MPHHRGQRGKTRHLFAKAFRRRGATPLSRLLTNFKKGDYVDVMGDGSVQAGLPHKFYHGKTGRVFDVTKHAVGVIVNKRVNTRIVPKRIHIRIEHVRQSKSRQAFVDRVHANDAKKREAKTKGVKISTKRVPAQPRASHTVESNKTSIEYMNPIMFRELY